MTLLPSIISLLIFLALFIFFFRVMFFILKIFLIAFVLIFMFVAVNQDKFECKKVGDVTHCHMIDSSQKVK